MNSISNLLMPIRCVNYCYRSLGKNVYNWRGEGIQYPGFKYYPRNKDFKDPPYTPTKLFRVQRIKPVKGTPWWERNILKELKLDGKTNDVVIIKNIPENNSRLWRIKHLIKIVPITFPNGFPQDVTGTFLKENGELTVMKSVVPVEVELIEQEKIDNNVMKMDGNTLRKALRKKWLNGWQ
ncbi:mitochondrial ribosomal protein l30 [Holotrichia oblita]|uniref:Mitochondrial ribosomal protein l30 n=1 Tax=Holotrichia oblita TaxID=644536 RepID=A0ACB9SY28_HOLOL|nr:mitochondrial ribosomal protein l30 [Holotrichia oblita]